MHISFSLSLDPHTVEELSFHDSSVILQHLCLEEVITYLNCPAAHFNGAAMVYMAMTASYPLARQFLPAKSPLHSIIFIAHPADLSALSMTIKVWQKTMSYLCSLTPSLHTAVSWDGWEPISLLQLAMPLLVHKPRSCALAFFRLLEQVGETLSTGALWSLMTGAAVMQRRIWLLPG
ncbi:hypothetical protein MVEN_00295500 [Mycena venus]|uniref:Uncharacterized protein n=1 Tax=Mycena venus TaxID=2733690 RepID=A0A8H6YYZ6_9AGAR|nr:hypothetical protein MVEN_00295500 [Mycena venus]